MLRVDKDTSTVWIENETGYRAVYDLAAGRLLAAGRGPQQSSPSAARTQIDQPSAKKANCPWNYTSNQTGNEPKAYTSKFDDMERPFTPEQ